MATYQCDFNYKILEYGSTKVDATGIDEAENLTYEYVRETFPDVYDIEIEGVLEIKE